MISKAEQDLLEVMDEGRGALTDLGDETYPRNLLGAIRMMERDPLVSALFAVLVASSDDDGPTAIRDLRDQWREDAANRRGQR